MKLARSLVLIEIEEDSLLAGAKAVEQAFSAAIEEQGLAQEIRVAETGNLGIIGRGVVVVIYPEGTTYVGVTEADVPEIVSEHLLKGRPVKRLQACLAPCRDREKKGLGLTREQPRIVLKNCGIIDPESLEEAIAVGAYEAVERVLTDWTFPALVLEEVSRLSPFWEKVAERLTRGGVFLSAGQYTVTPDSKPILGPCPLPGLYLNLGYSGHGVMAAPEGSRQLVEMILGRLNPEESPFGLSRFQQPTAPLSQEQMVI